MAKPVSLNTLYRRLRYKHLHLLEVLSRAGNLHAAAREMNLTQPAVTKILQDVEEIFGGALFTRDTRGTRPTDLGTAAIEIAVRSINDVGQLIGRLEIMRAGGAGTLAIGAIMATAADLLPTAIQRQQVRRPFLRITLLADTSDRLSEALDQKRIDLAISRHVQPIGPRRFRFEPLGKEILWAFAARDHPLAAQAPHATLAELLEWPWVIQPHASPMRQLLERHFATACTRGVRDAVETTSIFATLELVRRAGMIAVLPRSVLSDAVERGEFVMFAIEFDNDVLAPYGILTRFDEPMPAQVTEFVEIVREAALMAIAPAQ
jgi:DNA-binding transcriptional LysR family regulator